MTDPTRQWLYKTVASWQTLQALQYIGFTAALQDLMADGRTFITTPVSCLTNSTGHHFQGGRKIAPAQTLWCGDWKTLRLKSAN